MNTISHGRRTCEKSDMVGTISWGVCIWMLERQGDARIGWSCRPG
uniref:Uncharacterized protein n=1 Tax=Arundo donax TaxID=35708 RepID=A0A0A9B466_ARUDO